MIALVISIIVMLILAGVSISAIVGEDGIITKAQGATFMQSCAVLEEYINQYYVEHYDELNDLTSKVEGVKQLQPNWFFTTKLGYIVNSDGDALYLIKKSGLPNDLKNQLKGGEANGDETNYSNYANLIDVYGITSDLKVYYCSNGKSSMIGCDLSNLDSENPNRVVFSDTSSGLGRILSDYDENADGNISSQEIRAVKQLTIDNSSGINSLEELRHLTSLEMLTIKNLILENLIGLESCSNLYYIFFQGCIINDYSTLKNLSNQLEYLYFYNIDDIELNKVCSSTLGIGEKDFSKLQYFAVTGNLSYINQSNTPGSNLSSNYISSGKSTKTISNISPFNNLSSITKKNILYLSLQNNNITDLNGISDFSSVKILHLEYNKLTSLSGVGSLTNLVNLYADYNLLTSLDNFLTGSLLKNLTLAGNTTLNTLNGINNCTQLTNLWAYGCDFGNDIDGTIKNVTNDSLASLSNKTSLSILDLRNNSNMKWVEYLQNDTNIRYMYLDGCTGMDSFSFQNLKSIINACIRVSYPSSYTLSILDNTLQKVTLKSQTLKQSEFENLKGKTNVTHLSIYDVNITNNDGSTMEDSKLNELFNSVLSSMTGITYLQIYSSNNTYSTSKLNNINFVGENKITKLKEIDLRGTAVVDLSNLNTYATNLRNLIINNKDTNLSNIQTTINKIYDNDTEYSYFISGNNAGLLLYNSNLYLKLSQLNNITGLKIYTGSATYASGVIDLTECVNLTKMVGYRSFTGATLLKLPPELTYYGIKYNQPQSMDFSKCKKLTTLKLADCSIYNESALNSILVSLNPIYDQVTGALVSGCPELTYLEITEVTPNIIDNLDSLSALNNSNINTFIWSSAVHKRYNLFDISGIKYLTKLTNLEFDTIYAQDISSLKPIYDGITGKLITGCPNLTSIRINSSAVTNIDVLSYIPSLQSIIVTNSNVSKLGMFENLINLQTLDLRNNCIYNNSSYLAEDGTTVSYNVIKVLANLNREHFLTKLLLSGNNIDDYSELNNGTTFSAGNKDW